MDELTKVWKLAEGWDRKRPHSIDLTGCCAQLYLGAMEIPLVVFRPRPHVQPRDDCMEAWRPVLATLRLVLDPVETDLNYKINRAESNEYVARILPDALKLHCARILDLGPNAFERIVNSYLGLPRAV